MLLCAGKLNGSAQGKERQGGGDFRQVRQGRSDESWGLETQRPEQIAEGRADDQRIAVGMQIFGMRQRQALQAFQNKQRNMTAEKTATQ